MRVFLVIRKASYSTDFSVYLLYLSDSRSSQDSVVFNYYNQNYSFLSPFLSLSLSVSSWSLPSLFSRRRRLSLFFSLNIRIIIPSRSNLHYNVPPPSTHSRKTIFSYYASLFFLSLCLKLVGKLWTDRVKRKREENAEEEQGKESVPMRGWW